MVKVTATATKPADIDCCKNIAARYGACLLDSPNADNFVLSFVKPEAALGFIWYMEEEWFESILLDYCEEDIFLAEGDET